VKMLLLLVGFTGSALLSLAATSHAAPLGNGFRGGNFQGRLVVHNSGHVFRMGRGVRRGFPFRRDRRFFSRQVIWPVYWYPYFDSGYYPWDDSYLDNGSNYGYWDNSAASVQPQYIRPSATPAPVVIVINQGNPRSTDASNAEYADGNSRSIAAEAQQRILMQKSGAQLASSADPVTFVSPAAAPSQAAAQPTPSAPQAQSGVVDKLVLVTWLKDDGKDQLYVQNTETNEMQKITSEPNKNNFRIVEVRPNADPRQFEAVISNGIEQIPVKFRF
jgi:hypothetical protein